MSDSEAKDSAAVDAPTAGATGASASPKPRRRGIFLKVLGGLLTVLLVALIVGRLYLPTAIEWYVNRALQQNPMFRGKIDGVHVALYRGAYAIDNVRFIKLTGQVPVPLFRCDRLDLAIEWSALLHGRVVGKVRIDRPEINFVDAVPDKGQKGGDDPGDQTGGGGPWLQILSDLFPFKINHVDVVDGSVHFRTYQDKTPVDVYLADLQASVDNLTNVQDSTNPLATTIQATALAMDQAKFQLNVKVDPFSYRPTFHLTTRLLNLDVTKLNALTRTYGSFDFEGGWLDLVIDVDAREGQLFGYVKPLFRRLVIFSGQDLKEDNPLDFFWEALVGGTEFVLKNQGRDQFGTVIPFKGDVSKPAPGILNTIGNVLRNAFIRAYLPRLQTAGKIDDASLLFSACRTVAGIGRAEPRLCRPVTHDRCGRLARSFKDCKRCLRSNNVLQRFGLPLSSSSPVPSWVAAAEVPKNRIATFTPAAAARQTSGPISGWPSRTNSPAATTTAGRRSTRRAARRSPRIRKRFTSASAATAAFRRSSTTWSRAGSPIRRSTSNARA